MNRKDSLAAGYKDIPIGGVGRCPACLKNTYYQTTATERCNSCGYFFDYWDCKSSPQYDAYQAQQDAREELERDCCTCGGYPPCRGDCDW